MFCISNVKAQFNSDFKDEKSFKEYLVNHILDLDPIEGIWKINYRNDLNGIDQYGNNVLSIPITTDARWIIYKKQGQYRSYVSNESFIWDGEGSVKYLSYSFEKTAQKGVYLYTVNDGDYQEGYAYLNGNSISISRSKTTKTNQYLTKVDKMKIDGFKLSPNSDDIDEAVKKNSKPKEPDKVSGTGFIIGNAGYLVTANHVVEGMNFISVKDLRDGDSKSYSCVVLEKDKVNDIAILKIVDENFKGVQSIPYSFRSSKVQVGEDVFTLGYPFKSTMGEEIKLTNGIVSANSGFEGDTTMLQISVPVQPGNSGGPLFDKNGNLIGIIVAKYTKAENASYAVKAIELKKLLKLLPVSSLPSTSLIATKDLPSKVSFLKNYVFIIEAER